MSWIEICLGVILLISAILIVIVVLFQEGQQQSSANTSSESTNTFFSKNKSLSIDAFLARWTKIISITFFLLVMTLNVVSFFLKKGEREKAKPELENIQSQQKKEAEEKQASENAEEKKEEQKENQ
ncbi:MAG: preprotein translocase subunit SecG [Oscillospiraceae bacterium]|jgi:preprotein translocase subunit SecG|nr:preprotein translocase subunit SecG [Oscillospiraceae bacterium]